MYRFPFLILLVFVFTGSATAQLFFVPGYVVRLKGDTIRGELKAKDNKAVWFRSRLGGPDRQYTPGEIVAYSAENQLVKTAEWVENGVTEQVFLKEVSRGQVGLFELIRPDERLTHVIQLPNKTFVPLRKSVALLLLNQHLTGCTDPSVKQLLASSSYYFSRSYFERVINAYNQCINPRQVQPLVKKKFRYEAGLLAGGAANSWYYGANQDKYNLAWNSNGSYSTDYKGIGGLFFTLAPEKRLSLGVELVYTSVSTDQTITVNNPLDLTDKRTRLYSFQERYFTLPISGRFVVANVGSVRLYAKAGASLAYKFDVGGKYSGDNIVNAPIAIRQGVGIGYLLGIGAQLPISDSRHLLVELRTLPHVVMDGVTRLATSRSYQFTVAVPLISR
ncbi:hypothetical protein [Fibrella forsythiae]|uniref:Outer membrane protein beta-barrel domain-containing protein n=1 Tax=Fibrella forsythiae TaxID=2817061 RepID=A0ABS3JFM3_9BACT|nr:hypothetical protein [Fibrella forsythiae]MBO0948803.1 hypothetical protein [Fibrella forsythiae]